MSITRETHRSPGGSQVSITTLRLEDNSVVQRISRKSSSGQQEKIVVTLGENHPFSGKRFVDLNQHQEGGPWLHVPINPDLRKDPLRLAETTSDLFNGVTTAFPSTESYVQLLLGRRAQEK